MTFTAPTDGSRRFVDLHSHLVPGVDDGAETVQEALDALAMLADDGVEGAVTTPHLLVPHIGDQAGLQAELDRHRRGFARVANAAERADDLPWIALGQEILAPDRATARRALALAGIGLANERYLLVEFGFALRGRPLDVIRTILDAACRAVFLRHRRRGARGGVGVERGRRSPPGQRRELRRLLCAFQPARR